MNSEGDGSSDFDQDEWDEAMEEYGEEADFKKEVQDQAELHNKIKDLMREVTINYFRPNSLITQVVAICGEFNSWVPQNMQRVEDTEGQFKVQLRLIKGYRYRFAFLERPSD